MKIQDYINAKIDNQVHAQNYHIGIELDISSGMLSHYRTGKTKQPSLDLAKKIYKIDKVTIYPYSLEAVSEEEE